MFFIIGIFFFIYHYYYFSILLIIFFKHISYLFNTDNVSFFHINKIKAIYFIPLYRITCFYLSINLIYLVALYFIFLFCCQYYIKYLYLHWCIVCFLGSSLRLIVVALCLCLLEISLHTFLFIYSGILLIYLCFLTTFQLHSNVWCKFLFFFTFINISTIYKKHFCTDNNLNIMCCIMYILCGNINIFLFLFCYY